MSWKFILFCICFNFYVLKEVTCIILPEQDCHNEDREKASNSPHKDNCQSCVRVNELSLGSQNGPVLGGLSQTVRETNIRNFSSHLPPELLSMFEDNIEKENKIGLQGSDLCVWCSLQAKCVCLSHEDMLLTALTSQGGCVGIKTESSECFEPKEDLQYLTHVPDSQLKITSPAYGSKLALKIRSGNLKIIPDLLANADLFQLVQNLSQSKFEGTTTLRFCIRLLRVFTDEVIDENCRDFKAGSGVPTFDVEFADTYMLEVWIDNFYKETRHFSVFDVVPAEWNELKAFGFDFHSQANKVKPDRVKYTGLAPDFLKLLYDTAEKKISKKHARVILYGQIYEGMKERSRTIKLNQAIPRIIHQVWMQGEEHLKTTKPEYYEYVLEWKRKHANWHHILWNESQLRHLIANDETISWALSTFDEFDHFIKRIDFARYLLLLRFGGVTIDVDIESLKSIDQLVSFQGTRFLVSEEEEPIVGSTERLALPRFKVVEGQLPILIKDPINTNNEGGRKEVYEVAGTELFWQTNNAFVMSSAFNPVMWWVAMETVRRQHMNPRMHVLKATGPVLLTQLIEAYYIHHGTANLVILDKNVYPWTNLTAFKGTLTSSYGVHHMAQSWVENYETSAFFKA